MSLEPCRECQQEISGAAKTCPRCGASTPTETSRKLEKQGMILAGIFVGSLLFLFFGIPIIVFGWPLILGGLFIYGIVRLVRFLKARNVPAEDPPLSKTGEEDGV